MDTVEEINNEQLMKNQNYVRHISNIAGSTADVDIEFDASFPSRPKSGYEGSTQSFAPVIEQTTSKGLCIGVETSNKQCRLKDCLHTNCKKKTSVPKNQLPQVNR